MITNILSFGGAFVKDYLSEQILLKISKTFSEEQVTQYEQLETAQNISIFLLWTAVLSIPLTLITSNYLFFWQDVDFWSIFVTNLILIPFLLSYTAYYKSKVFFKGAKFYMSLTDNIKNLSFEERERIYAVINKVKRK